jgi:hypothetical protein
MSIIPARTRVSDTVLLAAMSANPDGGTLRFVNPDNPLPVDGYFVALPVGGIVIEPSTDRKVISDWLTGITPRNNPTFRDSLFVGWWRDIDADYADGAPYNVQIIHLEPVIHVAFMPDALRIASALSPTHIYSIAQQTSLPVNELETVAGSVIFSDPT